MTCRAQLYRAGLSAAGGCLLAALGSAAFSAPASAAGERITGLAATVTDNKIVVSGELTQWFSRAIEDNIGHGIAKDLFFYILLKRREAYWYDEELLAMTLQRTIQYDLLTKRYVVTIRPDKTAQARQETFDDLGAARALLSKVDRATLTSRDRLRSGEVYYVSMKAEMRAGRVPRYLEYFLFFIPFLDVSTPWTDSSPFSAASPAK